MDKRRKVKFLEKDIYAYTSIHYRTLVSHKY